METKIVYINNMTFILGLVIYLNEYSNLRMIKLKLFRKGGRLIKKIEKTNNISITKTSWIMKLLLKENSIYEKEVYSSCIILKNLAIVQKEIPMSQDFIIEQLMENTLVMRPIYAEILSSLRGEKEGDISDIMVKKIKSRSSKNFALILEKIDKINPTELLEQIGLLEQIILEERKTARIRQADINSLIITIFATATIFALLLNFAVVVVFMDTLSMLSDLV